MGILGTVNNLYVVSTNSTKLNRVYADTESFTDWKEQLELIADGTVSLNLRIQGFTHSLFREASSVNKCSYLQKP